MRSRKTIGGGGLVRPPMERKQEEGMPKEPEAVQKDARNWNKEDQIAVLNYLASLVASTFDDDISMEDVKRVLEEERGVLRDGGSTTTERDGAVTTDVDSSEDLPLCISDVSVSPSWREKLSEQKKHANAPAETNVSVESSPPSTLSPSTELSPPKRKWECTKCGSVQEIVDAKRVIRSKASIKSVVGLKSANLKCSQCGYSPTLPQR